MRMRNKIIAAVLGAALVITAAGCTSGSGTSDGNTADSTSAEKNADITAEALLSDIDNSLLDGKLIKGEDKFDSNAAKFYGTELENIEDGGILYNTEGVNADEVSAVRFKEGTDGQALLKKRLDDRTATFKDYRPEEVGKLESAKLFSAGGYDVLIISDDADKIESQLREKLE